MGNRTKFGWTSIHRGNQEQWAFPSLNQSISHCIFPICSSQNLNEYMQNRYTQHGRRRGEGIVTHSMGLQLVKAVTDLRNKERNRRIIEQQSRDWLLRHAEFLQTGKGVLRSQDVVNTLNAMKRRDDDFKTANCVDVKRSKHRLIGSEQLKLALWAWQHGEPKHFRILSEFNVGRVCGDRQGSLCTTRLRHLLTVRRLSSTWISRNELTRVSGNRIQSL